jgi:hypothetical protein
VPTAEDRGRRAELDTMHCWRRLRRQASALASRVPKPVGVRNIDPIHLHMFLGRSSPFDRPPATRRLANPLVFFHHAR